MGGLINFFILFTSQIEKKNQWWLLLIKSISLGLGASIIVPLFLETISSNILEVIKTETFPEKNYFVIAGFCLLASIFSKRFIEDVFTRVMKAEKDAQEAKIKVNEFEDSKSEFDDDDIPMPSGIGLLKGVSDDIENTKKVIKAILQSQYTYRTLSGIARDSKLDKETVANILANLKAKGFAKNKQNKQGSYIWKIIVK